MLRSSCGSESVGAHSARLSSYRPVVSGRVTPSRRGEVLRAWHVRQFDNARAWLEKQHKAVLGGYWVDPRKLEEVEAKRASTTLNELFEVYM